MGILRGIWNLTLQVPGYTCDCFQGPSLKLSMYSMARYWSQSPVLGMSWNTRDQFCSEWKQISRIIKRNIKTKSPNVQEMAYQTLVRPQLEYASVLFGTPTLRRMPIRLKWSRDAQPGVPQTIMPERLASLHSYTSWTCKHLKRDDQWAISVSFKK